MEKSCSNCGLELKVGMFSSVSPLHIKEVQLINEYADTPKEGYCTKCGSSLLKEAGVRRERDIKSLQKHLKENIHHIPIMTIPPPAIWDYDIIDMISAQSVTGTGVMSELSSNFNDLFGSRSNTLSSKLRSGEDFCKAQLRVQCIELGCHAIVGADIDYSEMGSLRGMMMVCIAGTAIKIKNTEVLGKDREELLKKLVDNQSWLIYWESL